MHPGQGTCSEHHDTAVTKANSNVYVNTFSSNGQGTRKQAQPTVNPSASARATLPYAIGVLWILSYKAPQQEACITYIYGTHTRTSRPAGPKPTLPELSTHPFDNKIHLPNAQNCSCKASTARRHPPLQKASSRFADMHGAHNIHKLMYPSPRPAVRLEGSTGPAVHIRNTYTQ